MARANRAVFKVVSLGRARGSFSQLLNNRGRMQVGVLSEDHVHTGIDASLWIESETREFEINKL